MRRFYQEQRAHGVGGRLKKNLKSMLLCLLLGELRLTLCLHLKGC